MTTVVNLTGRREETLASVAFDPNLSVWKPGPDGERIYAPMEFVPLPFSNNGTLVSETLIPMYHYEIFCKIVGLDLPVKSSTHFGEGSPDAELPYSAALTDISLTRFLGLLNFFNVMKGLAPPYILGNYDNRPYFWLHPYYADPSIKFYTLSSKEDWQPIVDAINNMSEEEKMKYGWFHSNSEKGPYQEHTGNNGSSTKQPLCCKPPWMGVFDAFGAFGKVLLETTRPPIAGDPNGPHHDKYLSLFEGKSLDWQAYHEAVMNKQPIGQFVDFYLINF